jgi:transaldolase
MKATQLLHNLDGGNSEKILTEFGRAGIKIDALAVQLQEDDARSFLKSWNDLMTVVESKSLVLKQSAHQLSGAS